MTKASETQLLRCVRDLEKGNVAHTLAHCLFWAQHATHEKDGRPLIYKTGPEIASNMPVTARTANEHFKTLAEKGYWTIEYRSRPGRAGPVTWLHFSDRSMKLIATAVTIDLSRKRQRPQKHTSGALISDGSGADGAVGPMSEKPASSQKFTTAKTAKEKAFILHTAEGKTGKNEPPQHTEGQGEGHKVKSPGWMKLNAATEHLANYVERIWSEKGVPAWDWTSQYTWRHLDEIRVKLAKRQWHGMADVERVFEGLADQWHWLRCAMADRYSAHPTNLHRPSPLALAFEFDTLLSKLEGKWADLAKAAVAGNKSNIDGDF